MTQWLRCYWDEEEVWFYFEADDQGWVTRQVELQGPGLNPIAAASLAEWRQAHEDGRSRQYESKYGITADAPLTTWDGYNPQYLSQADFERVWQSARSAIEARQ